MKQVCKYVLFFFFLLLVLQTQAQFNIDLKDTSLEVAMIKARARHKPVFLMCFASWCPHCAKMKKQVFTDSAVAAFYNGHFVCVAIDMEKGKGVDLHKFYGIKSYPTFIFLDSNSTVLYRTTGEFKPDEFVWEGMNALNPQRQINWLKKQFEGDVSNPEKCYDYLRTLRKAELDHTVMLQQYLATQSNQQLLSEVNWRILANGIHDISSPQFRFILDHQSDYARLASPQRVENKIVYTIKEVFEPLVDSNDLQQYAAMREKAAGIQYFKVDSLFFNYDIQLYEKNLNWPAYQATTLKGVFLYAWNNYAQLNKIAGNYLQQVSDTNALVHAIQWVQHSLALQEEYGTYILCAKLYKKINHKTSARQMAQKGKDMALKYGWDHADADRLLEELGKW